MNAIYSTAVRRIAIVGIVLSLFVTANLVFQSPAPVHAATLAAPAYGETPPTPTAVATDDTGDAQETESSKGSSVKNIDKKTDGFDVVNNIVFTIVKGIVGFLYLGMFLIFAVGSVKNATFSLGAQKFGLPHMMSSELMNLVGGIALFLLGLATLPIVNWMIEQSADLINHIVITVPQIDPSIVTK